MESIKSHIADIRSTLPKGVQLVCVSKFQPIASLQQAYDAGERDFAESRVQEMLLKHSALPSDIRWHFIGHLQTNKVRAILPWVHLIQSVDSVHLLDTLEVEAARIQRKVNILLEVHVAQEESKTGFTPIELQALDLSHFSDRYPHLQLCGLMGMATQTHDETEIHRCFRAIASLAALLPIPHPILSMGMSEDYPLALQDGSTMVRIGSLIFGARGTMHDAQ